MREEREDTTIYQVVINFEEQYSIWPVDREIPYGWRAVGVSGPKDECLAYIGKVWTDMRPLSLRKKMEEDARRRESVQSINQEKLPMANLKTIEGIDEVYAQKLNEAGYNNTETFLLAGATPKGRQEIAEKSGISEKLILKWLNRADLFRIKGIGEEWSDLLETAGVDTVPDLAQRNPENLYQALAATNEEKKRVRQLPTQAQVADWIEQAQKLPRILTY